MNSAMQQSPDLPDSVAIRLRELLDRQRRAFLDDGPPSAAVRRDRLDRCIGLLVDHQDELAAAMEDRKSTRLNSSHEWISRMPSSA